MLKTEESRDDSSHEDHENHEKKHATRIFPLCHPANTSRRVTHHVGTKGTPLCDRCSFATFTHAIGSCKFAVINTLGADRAKLKSPKIRCTLLCSNYDRKNKSDKTANIPRPERRLLTNDLGRTTLCHEQRTVKLASRKRFISHAKVDKRRRAQFTVHMESVRNRRKKRISNHILQRTYGNS